MAYFQSCFPPDDEFDEVAHKSDEEEDDILSAVAAMKQRDADVQLQLPPAARTEPEEEAVRPSYSGLEASNSISLLFSASGSGQICGPMQCLGQGNVFRMGGSSMWQMLVNEGVAVPP